MRKLRNILMVAMVFLFMAGTSWGANTIVYGTRTVGLSAIDTNYDFGADSTIGTPGSNYIILSIAFKPSAANDVICILDGAAAAKPALLYQTDITGAGLIVYPGTKCRPFLVVGDCTFSNAANVRVTITYKTVSDRW